MTLKLYWSDSHLKSFTARIRDTWLENQNRFVELDRTAFYPTGGGQPCDMGKIDSAQVTGVEMVDGDRILHRLNRDADFSIGQDVECQIDWMRRREIMQQHTGQHILSQAFFQLTGAETRGFRITEDLTEIDLTLDSPPEVIEEVIDRTQELANSIVFDNREIRAHEVTPEEAARLPLRKESFITDLVRVIEIDGFDWSPCGGTHAKRTGEVGLIAVRSWERAKKMARVHFVCGVRALRDYRAANQVAEAVARRFSVARDQADDSVARLFDENKQLIRRVRELSGITAKVEAQELIEATNQVNGIRIISRIFTDRDFEELKLLAHRLADQDGVIALLATRQKNMAQLVFARSNDLSADMNEMIKIACQMLGGRGGGKPGFATGGGALVSELDNAIELVRGITK
ncbi:MAG: DHHA1 domain-containing protein [Acidobacteria bacterium]|nr:DHHA1 domain-containing protein [Acidobacteriota bacterium]